MTRSYRCLEVSCIWGDAATARLTEKRTATVTNSRCFNLFIMIASIAHEFCIASPGSVAIVVPRQRGSARRKSMKNHDLRRKQLDDDSDRVACRPDRFVRIEEAPFLDKFQTGVPLDWR